MKAREKCYIVRHKKSKMLQGAFHHTKEGKAKAQKYLKKISNSKNFEIVVI